MESEEMKPFGVLQAAAVHVMNLSQKSDHKPFLVGIDGRCASGKTGFSKLLETEYGCSVIHADDFFLRPEQRSEQRYATPGGNLDVERLIAEVMEPLKKGILPLTYRKFDCVKMELGELVTVPSADTVIVEGSYSLHPKLRDYYDLRIFLDVTPSVQLKRIEARNGKEKLEVFRNRWIPLEELYFSGCGGAENAEMCINTSLE